MSAKVHKVDTRLFVNAGMRFPACQAGAKLLDTDKGHWDPARMDEEEKVTCLLCRRIK